MTHVKILVFSVVEIDVNTVSTPKTDATDQSEESKVNLHTTGLIFFGIGMALLVIGVMVLIVIRKAGNGGNIGKGKLSGNTQEILYFVYKDL